jgi:butyrate kinase
MKVYLITEAQMQKLAERVELAAHRTTDGLQICVDENKRQGVRDAFRAMNFQVQSWIGEMGKPQ